MYIFFLRAAAEFCVWQKSSEYTSDVTRLWANRCLRSCPFWNEKRGVTLEVYCMLGPSLKVISARQSSLAQNVPEILAIRVFFSMKMERSYHSHPSDGDRIQCWPAVGFTLPAPFSPNLISFWWLAGPPPFSWVFPLLEPPPVTAVGDFFYYYHYYYSLFYDTV